MKIAVIGGGAAGFFSAIHAKENHPEAQVSIFEKTSKVLSKVKLTGGGRCNVTNATFSIKDLTAAYPRGQQLLKKAFGKFNSKDTMEWFEKRGIELVTQEDLCVFPASQNSMSIINCLLQECNRLNITIELGKGIKSLKADNEKWILQFSDDTISQTSFDKLIITTGGSPHRQSLEWLEKLHHEIEEPIPSLFTFNMPNEAIRKLMGIVIDPAMVHLQGTKLKAEGALLITHWGMSGPAILKLSAFGARYLFEQNYQAKIQVNWTNTQNTNLVQDELNKLREQHPQKLLQNLRPYSLPDRLWTFLLEKAEIPLQKKWAELSKKNINKLIEVLTNDIYCVQGKTTFREEFVTSGGISLNSINTNTLESITCKNIYFAGEVLDIDGITGGFNLQAAWTTGFIAGKLA